MYSGLHIRFRQAFFLSPVLKGASSVLFALMVLAGCTQPEPRSVSFSIDMREPIAAGWFDPQHETVGIRGGTRPLSWDRTIRAVDKEGDGLYTAIVVFSGEMAPDQTIEYKFKVEGIENPNDGWENERNRQIVPGQAVSRRFDEPPPDLPTTFTGTIRTHEDVTSQHLHRPRDVFVYLPPGYDTDPSARYPVLYLHDGRNVFDASEVGMEWEVDEAAERLIGEGRMAPVIIVGVGNTPARTDEYTPTSRTWRFELNREGTPPPVTDSLSAFLGTYRVAEQPDGLLEISQQEGTLYARLPFEEEPVPLHQGEGEALFVPGPDIMLKYTRAAAGSVSGFVATRPPEGGLGNAYGRFLVKELKPFIDEHYRTLDGPAHTGLGGSSLGGLITMYLGLEYPEVFGCLGVVSPSVWWDDGAILRRVEAFDGPVDQRIWLDIGTAEGDDMVGEARRLRDALQAKGWVEGADFKYVEAEGAEHNETAWANRAEAILTFLFPKAMGS